MKKARSKGKSMNPDAKWIRARQDLLRQIKEDVQKHLGPEPQELVSYRKSYEREFLSKWQSSSKAELLVAIENSDIVYAGDFHALGQAQRTQTRILRSLSLDRPIVIAMESFSARDQKWLDRYIEGRLALDDLRKKTKWDSEWGFPWENYRPLLELARQKQYRLLGLNQSSQVRRQSTLFERDCFAAEQVREVYLLSPDALIFVIFGDWHLAPSHLPKAVREQLPQTKNVRDLIIHLNSERVYFQLARQGREHAIDVVRFSGNQFCVMSSPPWVQWQSYLLFLERETDGGLSYGEDNDEDENEFDYTEQVCGLINLTATDLGLSFKLGDISVYSSNDNRIWQKLDQRLSANDRRWAQHFLAHGKSFFIPDGGVGYLSRPTVNHAAHIAGEYIHAKLSLRHRPLWRVPGDFQALVWTEAIGFFVSKLVNHKRQPESLIDLRSQIMMASSIDHGLEAIKLAVNHCLNELHFLRTGRSRRPTPRPRHKASYFEAARILGGMMGERLYAAFRSRKLSAQELVALMKHDVTGRDFPQVYDSIMRLTYSVLGGRGRFRGGVGGKSKMERI